MHQIVCRQTPLGELTALPRPHICIQVATSKGEKVKKGRDMAEEGMGGRGRGERGGWRKGPEREGEGRKREGPHDPLAWGPPMS